MHSLSSETYSAPVSLKLHVGGEVIDVAQTGPDRIILHEARELAAVPAQLVITVAGQPTTHDIVLAPVAGKPVKEVSYSEPGQPIRRRSWPFGKQA